MKKMILPLTLVGLMAIGLVSCNKEYTCTCTDGTVLFADQEADSKDDAETACAAGEATLQIANPGTTCSLD